MNPMLMVAEASTPTLTTENITSATSNIFTVVGQTLNEVVTQPIFLMFFVAGLVFMSVKIIRALKHA